jgi:PAS domain S-box-containing protein
VAFGENDGSAALHGSGSSADHTIEAAGIRALETDALRLAAIVEYSDDAIVSKNLDGIVQTWNKAAERLFGYTAAEIIGKSITLIIPRDRLAEEDLVLGRIRAGQTVEHYETVRRAKDGRLIDVSLTVSPIRLPNGNIIGASKIARDITEQRQLRQAADEASRAKDHFLAMLSHELRTPLNAVLGYIDMLRNNIVPEQQRGKAIEIVARNAELLTRLVNDVLDTSRIVTGKLRMELHDCNLSTLVGEVVESVRETSSAKRVELTSQIPSDVHVQGDPDRLRQTIWNLLSNALKFTPAGGQIRVRLEADDTYVRVIVQDTGIGLSAESLPYLFQRFWQVQTVDNRSHGGLGLGLALTRHIVEMHGGSISARSAGLGQGSTFEVRLPAVVTV